MPGLTRGGSTLAVSLRRELWESFDAETQAIVSDVAAEYNRRTTSELRANDLMLRTVLGKTHGISFMPLSAALETEISRVAEAVVADIAARDALSQRINGAYMALHGAPGSIQPGQLIA
jgi:TRAP-type C4-dicarboxylate transport system substrate-binding protein